MIVVSACNRHVKRTSETERQHGMSRQTLIGCAFTAVMALGAHTAAAQDAKAAEILAKTRQALGGARLEALKTLSLEAATERNLGQMQMTGDIEILLELPDKFVKSETSRGMMAMTSATGFNGDKAIVPAGMSMAGGGAMVIRMGPGGPIQEGPELTPEQKAEVNRMTLRAARVELSRLMLGWFGTAHPSLGAQYTYAGEAESPDGKAYVIDVKDAEGFEARLFVDQNNHLPLMVTYKGRQPRMVTSRGPAPQSATGSTQTRLQTQQLSDEQRKQLAQEAANQVKRDLADAPMIEYSMFFEDWKQVDGITFPHLIRRGPAGETNEEWKIAKVKVNPKIDAKRFAVDSK
jgi:hypothetical protein